jgi:hypothetical protein
MRTGAGEAPEEAVVSDSVMATAGLAWLVLFGLSVNAAG